MDLGINPIHSVIWLVSFIGLIISIAYIIKYKEKRGYGITALTYFLDVFLYNSVLHLQLVWGFHFLTLQGLEIWSGVVRLHSLFLLISFLLIAPSARNK
jgi:hypothetical protein